MFTLLNTDNIQHFLFNFVTQNLSFSRQTEGGITTIKHVYIRILISSKGACREVATHNKREENLVALAVQSIPLSIPLLFFIIIFLVKRIVKYWEGKEFSPDATVSHLKNQEEKWGFLTWSTVLELHSAWSASQCFCLCLLVIHSGRQILSQVSHDLHTNFTCTVFRELLSTLFLKTIKIRRKPGVSIALINKSHLLPPPGLTELWWNNQTCH